MNFYFIFLCIGLTTAVTNIMIAIEMCMCGHVKWNRAKTFATKMVEKFDRVPERHIKYSIVQFAEDFIHEAYNSEDRTQSLFEDPEAFAGLSSNITAVSFSHILNELQFIIMRKI